MKKCMHLLSVFMIFALCSECLSHPLEKEDITFSLKGLEGIEKVYLSSEAKNLLQQNGFVVTPGSEEEIYDVYSQCKEKNQPIFVTSDSVLHTSHIFFDYLLRILEREKLYDLTVELTDRMILLSQKQFEEAEDEEIKEVARLNMGFFGVARKMFNPEYEPGYGLRDLIQKEVNSIEGHKGLAFRSLLAYVENPNLMRTPYAFEDYSQYIPRGHYTRNEEFKKYFKAMMWYGRIDFKLMPGESDSALRHGKMMTLQAILMVDSLMKDKEALRLWRMIYEPTVYFVGATDDLYVDDYKTLIKEVFPSQGGVDKYNDEPELSEFIKKAMELKPPKILSGTAFAEEGEFAETTRGFRFMGQRFIPDSYMFQELVFGRKGKKMMLTYTGSGKPFTIENLPAVGPARAFPRGLDVLAVLSSKRALEILEQEGDTEYKGYYDQLRRLQEEFSSLTPDEWKQNLYWRWLHCLIPLFHEPKGENVPKFMQNMFWTDKEIQTTLGSWTELRHDTILYAKQSYTMVTTSMPGEEPVFTYGYVEPYAEVYIRIKEMMSDMRVSLTQLGIAIPGIEEKIKSFEQVLEKLAVISEKERERTELSRQEYELIWNIGAVLGSLKQFPSQIMEKITSGTDERIDLVADVHTDINTKQVLEEAVGSPFNIYVIIKDRMGYRLCQGAVFSYYEFKHPMDDRLTDEKWQTMGKKGRRPPQPDWTTTFITK